MSSAPKSAAESGGASIASSGRPSKFTQALGDEVCERIVLKESIREIALSEHMPEERTIWRWLASNDEFRQKYARAKELQADAFAEELTEIADDGSNDWIEREVGRGKRITVVDRECTERSKLRVETRKWLMSKFKPKRYGDATTIRGDKDNPLQVAGVIVVPKKDVGTASPVAAKPKAG